MLILFRLQTAFVGYSQSGKNVLARFIAEALLDHIRYIMWTDNVRVFFFFLSAINERKLKWSGEEMKDTCP